MIMPRGDKDAYTDKQKRKAEHIEEGYETRGLSDEEAERRLGLLSTNRMGAGIRAALAGRIIRRSS
jgi:hypothetical protein